MNDNKALEALKDFEKKLIERETNLNCANADFDTFATAQEKAVKLVEGIDELKIIRTALTELEEIKKRAEEVKAIYSSVGYGIRFASIADAFDYILKGEPK